MNVPGLCTASFIRDLSHLVMILDPLDSSKRLSFLPLRLISHGNDIFVVDMCDLAGYLGYKTPFERAKASRANLHTRKPNNQIQPSVLKSKKSLKNLTGWSPQSIHISRHRLFLFNRRNNLLDVGNRETMTPEHWKSLGGPGLQHVSLAIPNFGQTDTLNLKRSVVSSGCSTTGPASCHNTTVQSNLCCFESPGGLLLQTQFWDTDPTTGPVNSWTIHGLWPDHCDGTFSENCDPSRDYTNISTLLTDNGGTSTLNFMNEFWVNDDGTNEEFWDHEWATHGTCYSTLHRSCLPSGSVTGLEAVAFFETVVNLFQTLPTYTFLSDAGITPSATKTYKLSALTSALAAGSGGFTPSLDCDGSTITQISWYFNLKGSVIDGIFVPINAAETGSCSSSKGLKYPPKST